MDAQQEKLNPDGSCTDGCLPAWAGLLVLVGAVLAVAVGVAHAGPPALPFSPYGTVKVDGANVADGTVVSAWCGGASYRQTPTLTYEGESWYANLDIPGDDPESTGVKEGCAAQETVSFRIGDKPAAQIANWAAGGGGRLDLTYDKTNVVTLRTFSATRLALPLPGNRGGCAPANYWTDIACTVVDAGRGWAFGDCELGYAFSGATRASLTAGAAVTVDGCLDATQTLLDGGRRYPLRIRAG